MYIVEVEGKPNKWVEHPVAFKNLDDAERYAVTLFKTGLNARVVDEKYRKGRHDAGDHKA